MKGYSHCPLTKRPPYSDYTKRGNAIICDYGRERAKKRAHGATATLPAADA